ncbi:nucleoside deaminase [Ruegeria arenilitoris]|uniref:nucleoside deaminase n=1 Tax=Ruegeria arenilitoris TaxID=1173585 RepID=UPI00147C4979|nr:nucleoside deaminase [Ruegeria arenilitoris]
MDTIGEIAQDGHSTFVFARRGFLAASGFGAVTVGLCGSVVGQTSASEDDSIPQPSDPNHAKFMERAFEMRQYAIDHGDQKYGAVVVRENVIIGQSSSRVVLDQDPTGHAEMAAIRDAARRLNDRDLSQAVMYSSSRPCPMCEAAAFWAGVRHIFYGREIRSAGSPTLCSL